MFGIDVQNSQNIKIYLPLKLIIDFFNQKSTNSSSLHLLGVG